MGQVQRTRLDLSRWVVHLSSGSLEKKELSGKVGWSGDRDQGKNED